MNRDDVYRILNSFSHKATLKVDIQHNLSKATQHTIPAYDSTEGWSEKDQKRRHQIEDATEEILFVKSILIKPSSGNIINIEIQC